MARRNLADIIAGTIFVVLGVAVAHYAAENYPIGTLRRMGPGMFPMWLGILIASLGGLLALTAWLRSEDEWHMPELPWRTVTLVVAGVVAFSLLVKSAGLIPAVLAVAGISSFADKTVGIVNVTLLSTILCAIAFAIFNLALGMGFKLLEWPF